MTTNYVSVDKLLEKAEGSRYKLAILAFKRAIEIAAGQRVLVETSKSNKPTTIALEEIAAGKVWCKSKERLEKEVKQEGEDEKADLSFDLIGNNELVGS